MTLKDALARRFQDAPDVVGAEGAATLSRMAARGSVRQFLDVDVSGDLIRMLCAVALSAPTKSDLQQRDIILITDPAQKDRLADLCAPQHWVAGTPALLVFCGNHRRQRRLHELRGHPFVNDHADAPINAAVDAGIALSAFVTAAEAAGLGCCPISAIRNAPEAVAEALALPDLVFPVAALAVGWPMAAAEISPRLPLSATLHANRFDDIEEAAAIAAYDALRARVQPQAQQRETDRFGETDVYTWSEDKARQYALPERTGFGAYMKRIGFTFG